MLIPSAFAPPAVLTLWPEGVPAAVRPDAPAARGDLGAEREVANGSPRQRVATHADRRAARRGPPSINPGHGRHAFARAGATPTCRPNREGQQYAAWLSTLGVTTFILKSRLQEWGPPRAAAGRAARHPRGALARGRVRHRPASASAVIGSSAGGHLAASASTLWDHPRRPHRRRARQQRQRPARLSPCSSTPSSP